MTEKKFNPFREAIKHLSAGPGLGGCKFICHSLDQVCCDVWRLESMGFHVATHKANRILTQAAVHHVQSCLGKYGTLETWLRVEHKINTQGKRVEMQAYRQRWLEHLANQYDNGELKL